MRGHQVLSYEGPFGVGYGVAVLHEHGAGALAEPLAEAAALPHVARLSVAAALGLYEADGPAAAGITGRQAPVFVTLRTIRGDLRGCVGTISPRHAHVVEETWFNARAAAFEDRRFTPLRPHELEEILFEVSMLHSFEDVHDAEEIDPRHHGVIVFASGARRGLLLPGIEGVDSAVQQIAIARRKGGIGLDEAVRLQRFRVEKYHDTQPVPP